MPRLIPLIATACRIALALCALVEQDLPEEARQRFADLNYHHSAREDGGLGLQVNPRRDPTSIQHLHLLKLEAEDILRKKRTAITSIR